MEPWQAWLALTLFTLTFAKSRLLLYDLSRKEEACHSLDTYVCQYYERATILDGIYVAALIVALIKLLV